jgi:hypothetical protein
MKHVFQIFDSLKLYLNTKSSKAPAPSTFEARRNSAVLLRALAKRKAAVLTPYSSPCSPTDPGILLNLGRAPALSDGAESFYL